MQRGLSLDAFAGAVSRGQTEMLDIIQTTKETEVVLLDAPNQAAGIGLENVRKLPALVVRGEAFRPNHNAHGQIAEITGIPAKYYNRLLADDAALFAKNVNRWLGVDGKNRMFRATTAHKLRAVLSDRYRRIDNYKIAEMVLPVLHDIPGMEIKALNVSDDYMDIYATTPAVQGETRKGDIIQAYCRIRNSETGNGSVRVEPGVLRKVCDNGLILPDHRLKVTHLGRQIGLEDDLQQVLTSEAQKAIDNALMIAMRDKIRFVMSGEALEKYAEKMGNLTSMEIKGDPAKGIELLTKKVGLTEEEGKNALLQLIKGGDATAYGLLNAVTFLAHDAPTFERASEIEDIGGKVLNLNKTEWRQVLEAA